MTSASQVALKRVNYFFDDGMDLSFSPGLEELVCWTLWQFPPVSTSLRKLELYFEHPTGYWEDVAEMGFDLADLTRLEELTLGMAYPENHALNAVSALTGLRALTLDRCGLMDVKTVFTGLTSLTRLSLNVSNSSRESFVPTLPASAPLRELTVTFEDMIGYCEMREDARVKVRLVTESGDDDEAGGDAGEDRETLDVSPFAGTLERLALGHMELGPGVRGLLRGAYPRLRGLDVRTSKVSCPGF